MSYILNLLTAERPRSIDILPTMLATFDERVQDFEPNVISYWKCDDAGATLVDVEGVQNGTITGNPERSVATIVDFDTVAEGAPVDGTCLAWPGTTGEYAEVAHNAAHKTSSGTIVVYHQHDNLSEKSTLVAGDAAGAAGGFSIEVNTNGSPRAYLRNSSGVPVVLTGVAGDIALNEAYTSFFKWGSGGLSLSLWDEAGNLIRRLTDTLTDGLTGTSAIRFGAFHGDVSHHDGPFARVVWMDRAITEDEEATLALAKTISHAGGGGGGGGLNSLVRTPSGNLVRTPSGNQIRTAL